MSEMVERVARAIADGPEPLASDYHRAVSAIEAMEQTNTDRQLALWLLSCTCATYEGLRVKKSAPKSEVQRHRSIIEKAYLALIKEGPMPPHSENPSDMQRALERAADCLASEPKP